MRGRKNKIIRDLRHSIKGRQRVAFYLPSAIQRAHCRCQQCIVVRRNDESRTWDGCIFRARWPSAQARSERPLGDAGRRRSIHREQKWRAGTGGDRIPTEVAVMD